LKKAKTHIFLLCFALLFLPQAGALLGQQLPQEMVITNRYANIRKGPGTGYEQVTTLYRGDRVVAERKYRNWLRILIPDGRVGWVREDLVGPYDPDDRPLTNEEADSLKELVESQVQLIAALEDSTTLLLSSIRQREQLRDSLLNLLGLEEVPQADTLQAEEQDTTQSEVKPQPRPKKPVIVQESLLTRAEPFTPRNEFSPWLGVLTFDGDADPAAGFAFTRNFTREFAYRASVSFTRRNPAEPGRLEQALERIFFTGGLIYSYKPGRVVVPFVELGSGAAYTQAADSSFTAFDLVFGAGCRLFLTQDLALEFGYQGHAVMGEGNELLNLFHLGSGFHFPSFGEIFTPRELGKYYLSPYVAYQMFSPRFALNSAPLTGMRLGYGWREKVAFELLAGYLPVEMNEGSVARKMNAAELAAQALYFPASRSNGLFLLAGGGVLLLGGEGRAPAGTKNYGFFHYGAGVDLQLAAGVSLRSELWHLIFPEVAEIKPDYEVAAGGALRLSAGVILNF